MILRHRVYVCPPDVQSRKVWYAETKNEKIKLWLHFKEPCPYQEVGDVIKNLVAISFAQDMASLMQLYNGASQVKDGTWPKMERIRVHEDYVTELLNKEREEAAEEGGEESGEATED